MLSAQRMDRRTPTGQNGHTLKWEEGRLAYMDVYKVIDSTSIDWAQVPIVYLLPPPFALLLVGSMLYWAFRGFSPD
jgi:hypothetical protein